MNNKFPAEIGSRTPTERTLLHCTSTNLVLSLTVSFLNKHCVKLHAGLAYQTRKECPSTYVWKKYLSSSLLVEDIVGC